MRVYETDAFAPAVGSGSPGGIGIVACITCETGGELEEGAVGHGVFVIVACVLVEDLPFQTPGARGQIPAPDLGVPECFDEGKPFGTGGGVVVFEGGHGSESPKGLVVVAFVEFLARHHKVSRGTDLAEESLGGDIVVAGVVRKVPVVYQRSPHRTGFPPVVGLGKDADWTAGIALVVFN